MAKKKAGKAKKNRIVVHLECTSCIKNDKPNVCRYAVYKNRKNTTSRLELKKHCRFERKHFLHKEVK